MLGWCVSRPTGAMMAGLDGLLQAAERYARGHALPRTVTPLSPI
jgi:hypothetical protein